MPMTMHIDEPVLEANMDLLDTLDAVLSDYPDGRWCARHKSVDRAVPDGQGGQQSGSLQALQALTDEMRYFIDRRFGDFRSPTPDRTQ
jgi:hypothetical protein